MASRLMASIEQVVNQHRDALGLNAPASKPKDDPELIEWLIMAELEAHILIRALYASPRRPADGAEPPPHPARAVDHLKAVQALLGETGLAWAQRVDTILAVVRNSRPLSVHRHPDRAGPMAETLHLVEPIARALGQ